MYVKRIQVVNYGPIEQLDITLPFEEEKPKPVLLIGENGSGKSILLSHIVNGLIIAKDRIYPHTPEVEANRVYKLRSSNYIKLGQDVYFARVDFEEDLHAGEIRSSKNKEHYDQAPCGLTTKEGQEAWNIMPSGTVDYPFSNFYSADEQTLKQIFSKNCMLFFPPNRFEDPAWLNEENLSAQANYMELKRFEGYSERRVINYSPLHDNQNWLFDVGYDSRVLEVRLDDIELSLTGGQSVPLTLFKGYSGEASRSYEAALQVLRTILGHDPSTRFGIGSRRERVVSVIAEGKAVVPNIFQLSTGETSLLNLFLSILRDYELSGAPFTTTNNVRGVVIVDEIDLHLHVSHQYSILPKLIEMFPKVQFIVTTHSPLFILGMRNVFGEGGFGLYRMPEGQEINPEDFSEFEEAYSSFSETIRFRTEVRKAVDEATKPIIFVEGVTDQKYMVKAAELLGRQSTLDKVDLRPSGGAGNLDILWNEPGIAGGSAQRVGLLYDCDKDRPWQQNGAFVRQNIHPQEDHPIKGGIENLFGSATINRARDYKLAFIDIEQGHERTRRGETIIVPERWTVNGSEKTNLCNWLCENGTADEFEQFEKVFDIFDEMLASFDEAIGGVK